MSKIPEWAYRRVDEIIGDYGHPHSAFARYIAEHEEPPVDPLLIEAREICAVDREKHGAPELAKAHREGRHDSAPLTTIALAALKRGIELAEGRER